MYVKATDSEEEVAVYKALSKSAVQESFGGIMLCYGNVRRLDGSQLLFLEESMGEAREARGFMPAVANAFVWMMEHGVIHGDLVGNNIFEMRDIMNGLPVTIHVAGDFDAVFQTNDVSRQLEILAYFLMRTRGVVFPPDFVVTRYLNPPLLKYSGVFPAIVKTAIRQREPMIKYLTNARQTDEESVLKLARLEEEAAVLLSYLDDSGISR